MFAAVIIEFGWADRFEGTLDQIPVLQKGIHE